MHTSRKEQIAATSMLWGGGTFLLVHESNPKGAMQESPSPLVEHTPFSWLA